MKMSEKELIARMLNAFYPVGCYFETSDGNFDPNTEIGGTWELEAEGLVHIGAGSTYAVGNTGGEAEHTLTVNEMPSHSHGASVPANAYSAYNNWGGSFAKTGISRYTEYWGTTATGGSQPHNNMQPYIVVNRWHRTA